MGIIYKYHQYVQILLYTKVYNSKYFDLFMDELISRIPQINLHMQSNHETLWDVCSLKVGNLSTGFHQEYHTINSNESFVL